MKMLQRNDGEGFKAISAEFVGSDDEMRRVLLGVRKETKERGWKIKYRLVNCVAIPR